MLVTRPSSPLAAWNVPCSRVWNAVAKSEQNGMQQHSIATGVHTGMLADSTWQSAIGLPVPECLECSECSEHSGYSECTGSEYSLQYGGMEALLPELAFWPAQPL